MLSGLKVVELASYVAAPAAGGMLADWGADVIKIEPPSGDPYRAGYEALTPDAASPPFQVDNRGKRSLVLDIGSADDLAALIRLLEDADVFLTNLRPSALKRAGLDWGCLRQSLPRLVYASVTGYGLEGPDADLPGYDMAAFWSRGGVGGLMTPKGEEPMGLRMAVGDHMCALATAAGIMTALYERDRIGRGRLVETSLLRTGVYAIAADMALYLRLGRISSTRPRKSAVAPLNNFFKTADHRWVCIMPRDYRTDWPKIAAVAGCEHLLLDRRFADDLARRKNAEVLVTALDAGFACLSYAELAQRLVAVDLVWAPVQSPAELARDPQAQAAGCFVKTIDANGSEFLAPAGPVRFPEFDERPRAAAPNLGEHSTEILTGIGIRDAVKATGAEGAATGCIEAARLRTARA